MRKYQTPQYINKKLAEEAFETNDMKTICEALVAVALHEQDWKWAQDKCLGFLESESSDIRGLAATCLGHIARIHRELDKEKVLSALQTHLSDEYISGQVSDALDDIEMFLK